MAQNNLTVLTGSGLDVRTGFNNAIQALASRFAGATDPASMNPSCAFPCMLWPDTGAGYLRQRTADNTAWVEVGVILEDGTFRFYPQPGTINGDLAIEGKTMLTGALHQSNPVSITSSGGVVALTEASNSFIVSGTEPVTSITGWTSGIIQVRWTEARTITHNSTTLILQGGANRSVAAGDISMFEMTATGAREIAYFPTTIQSNISFPLGTGNYIVSGRKVSSVSGFQVNLTAGQHVISDSPVSVAANAVTIPARSAALLYDKADGTTGQVLAQLPYSYIDNNTVGFWDFTNWDGSSAIPNSAVGYNGNTLAVANSLTKTGTVTKVDGWCGYAAQGDGSTGYFVSANSTGFPVGAAARGMDVKYTVTSVATGVKSIIGYGTASSGAFCQLYISGARFYFDVWGTGYDTGFDLEVGKTYLLSMTYNGSVVSLYVNGVFIYSVALTLATTAGVFRVFYNSSQFGPGIIHYIELRNAPRTSKQISDIANALLLPNRYYTQYAEEYINGAKLYDIATPENAISGGDYSGYPKSNAYDKNTTTQWASSQGGTSVIGVAWIGQKIPAGMKAKHMRHTNFSTAANNASSVLVQITTDQGLTWTTVQTQALSTAANAVNDYDVVDYAVSGAHWIRELANSAFTGTYLWNVYELNVYTDVQPTKFTDIRSILPTNTISLGFVRTNSSGIIAYNDTDYQYGRREKAYGGNRGKPLDWKYVTNGISQDFNNPFKTENVQVSEIWWKKSLSDIKHSVIDQIYTSNTLGYGCVVSNVSSEKITVATGATAVIFTKNSTTGADETTGFITIIAEVLEDD